MRFMVTVEVLQLDRVIAVSYTHLDVYKRQVDSFGLLAPDRSITGDIGNRY